ncbi:DUF6302 family protein [Streptomyces sp. NPDC049915]|uniref:DUF6302 family protein n=1 Tax=Streptomyces sp. NPDC049915 TaxID=3155510 RepID=UPI0034169B49
MTASTAVPLRPTLLPPQCAVDYEFLRTRLADPTVLTQSVAVQVYRVPLIAVAVGGPRHGGYLPVDLVTIAVAIRDLLSGQPGFPDVRVGWSPYRDSSHVVEWGGRPPPSDDVERGLFYGYRPDAIAAFVRQRSSHPARQGAVHT